MLTEDPMIIPEPNYASCLKNKMLCQYMDILNKYGMDLESEMAKDLEKLIFLSKSCGKDSGFRQGIEYGDLLWREYINSLEEEE